MHTIRERIDHALDVFRRTSRRDLVIGLTPADWIAVLRRDCRSIHVPNLGSK